MGEIRTRELAFELSYDERATWGDCQTCGAKHGTWCHGDAGLSLGRTLDGRPPPYGVHLGRLQEAPMAVKIVATSGKS